MAFGPVNPLAKFHDSIDHLINCFTDAQNLPRRQHNHGVGSLLDMLDQVRVQDDRGMVEARQPNHNSQNSYSVCLSTFPRGTLTNRTRGPIRGWEAEMASFNRTEGALQTSQIVERWRPT